MLARAGELGDIGANAIGAQGKVIVKRGRIEVAALNRRRVIADRDVDVVALLRIIRGLETLR
ncbi:hypothetical protein MYG64_36115 (plasmid) [Ensifer adhaerens]|uniref:hypothetical protein n=1 Tax=Ensifer adhaerens TaxID=106592 RepID=UPI002100801E|nr:hypothetical protein [Ensifer adhaerens]UTV41899.1 hypothetical protein MYG64_36115 [Ensifer adhaerens]